MTPMKSAALGLAALLLVSVSTVHAAAASCDAGCLQRQMGNYLDHLLKKQPAAVRLARDAIVRENAVPVAPGRSWSVSPGLRAGSDSPCPMRRL
mgnify:CR=1 FL=1